MTDLRLARPVAPAPIQPDEFQALAIAHHGSPLLILGGPGTGKTATLVESAVHRVGMGLAPEQILLLTYGRESAAALRDAIVARVGSTVREPIARTFHSYAFSILRRAAISNKETAPVLLSGPEQDLWIRELLVGEREEGIGSWPASMQAALTTDGFVRELRDLILRASERNLSPSELRELGNRHHLKEWVAAADFYHRYVRSMDMRDIRALDPSEIVIACWELLSKDVRLVNEVRSEIGVVLVDEYQESDPAQRALLELIAPRELVLAADPDSAVGRFRGADPEGSMASFERYGGGGQVIHLPNVHRSARSIVDLGNDVVRRIRRTGVQRERSALAGAPEGSVEILRFKSVGHEIAYVAQALRRAHLRDGIPYSQMAIILRAPANLASALQRALSIASVPTSAEAATVALARHSAVKPLLQIASIALDPASASYELVEELLLSPYGGADSLDIRRLRSELRTHSALVGDTRPFAELLLDAIKTPMADLDQNAVAPALRIRTLIEAARRAGARPGAQGEDVLWAIWNSALIDGKKVSTTWQDLALRGDRRGAQADNDLDAVVSLFESASRFSERSPGAAPNAFFRELTNQMILGDTIAAKAPQGERVEILTVHSAKGRQWRLVAVVGLQEGTWPNMRLRGTLLGSERLVELLSTTGSDLPEAEFKKNADSALLDDERRLFHVALTRAQETLLITSVANEDEQPSQFFNEVAGYDDKPQFADLPRALTLNALVARLRQKAETDDDRRPFAVALLSKLSRAGIKSADPESWWGQLPLSDQRPLAAPDESVRVSPSSVDVFEKCQLKWLLERNGGTRGEMSAQAIGTALHSVVAELATNPGLGLRELSEAIDRRWPSLDVGSGWGARRERARVEVMLEKFMKWHHENTRKLVGVEKEFEFQIDRAIIKGSMDRLEVTSGGEFFVVDLKTGRSAVSKADGADSAQLQLYQLAILRGAVEGVAEDSASAGAELLYVGTDTKTAAERRQEPIDVEAVRRRVQVVAEAMAGSRFTATTNDLCNTCNVRSSCPLQSDGRSVVAP